MGKIVATINNVNGQEQAFIDEYINSGDAKASAINSGYDAKTAKKAEIVLLGQAHIAWGLHLAVRKRFATLAPMALGVIESLAKDDKVSAKVRLDAARTLLDRAGHVAPRVADKGAETPMHEMSTDELKTLASRLEGELADRSKPVISAVAAPQPENDVDLVG